MGSPPRIACLHVPALPLEALLRAEPALRGAPLCLVEGGGPRAVVLHASAEAEGVQPGMTAAQARVTCARILVRPRSPALTRAALDALCDLAASVSPQHERTATGALLPIGDLGRLFPSEQAIGTALWAGAEGLGLRAQVAIAAGPRLAAVAARSAVGVTVVPAGEERRFLAGLPLEALGPGAALLQQLRAFGLRTVADLAALPRPPLALRLGGEGVQLHRLACGEDRAPLQPTPPAPLLAEALDLDDAIEDLEPLSFVLRGLLDRLVARLRVRSLGCADYTLQLDLSPRGQAQWAVQVAAPTQEVAILLRLGRAALQALPPAAPVRRLTLLCRPAALRPGQLDLFAPAGPAPARLGATLARVQALCGEGRVGSPAAPDSHLPERRLVTFPVSETRRGRDPRPPPLALRHAPHLLQPPRPAEVILLEGRPVSLQAEGASGPIVRCSAPTRVRVGWAQRPVLRDSYDVELAGGGLFRVFQDLTTNDWFLDACYD